MTGLLILTHGSGKDGSHLDFMRIMAAVKKELPDWEIETACIHTMEQAVAVLMEKEVTHIMVFPYFLLSGRHVSLDIPKKIDYLQQKYPEIKLEQLPYLGSVNALATIIAAAVKTKSKG